MGVFCHQFIRRRHLECAHAQLRYRLDDWVAGGDLLGLRVCHPRHIAATAWHPHIHSRVALRGHGPPTTRDRRFDRYLCGDYRGDIFTDCARLDRTVYLSWLFLSR